MIPFVSLFYGSPSVSLWEDDMGDTHEIVRGEGGEQGDPLMPLLFSLAAQCIGSQRTPHRRRVFLRIS